MRTVLFTGGSRSGKSGLAQQWVEAQGARRIYIATAGVHDAEMQARVTRHQHQRGAGWQTLEEGFDVARALQQCASGCHVILLDCITLWLTNMMLAGAQDEAMLQRVDGLVATVQSVSVPVALVTNEVGWGVVPESALGRRFRDVAGEANQRLAAACDGVVLAVSGLPLAVKGALPQVFR